MEPTNESRRDFRRGVEHPLAGCLLIASIVAFGTLVVTARPADPPSPRAGRVAIELATPPTPNREALRAAFFEAEVEPEIAETDSLNRQAADRCVERLEQLMSRYRQGVDPFVEDLTSHSTRLGIVRRKPAGWWKQDGRVEAYVQSKFDSHLYTEKSLASEVTSILEAFRGEVDANQKRMLVKIRASLDVADLPEIKIEDYDAFLTSVAGQLQRYSAQQGTSSVHNALTVLVLSEAGSYATMTLVSGLLARFGTAAATTAVAAGGATAGASAAGAGGGSLGGPVGTAVGLGVGLVIGLTIDWWMTEQFETELSLKMHAYLHSLEQSILYGETAPPSSDTAHPSIEHRGGIADALPMICNQLQAAYQDRFRDQIVHLEPSP